MIINNLGINFAGGGGSTGGTAVLTADTFTENRRYTPPTGVDGYSAVTVNVDVVGPYNSGYTEGYASGFTSGETEGYASGYTSGETVGYASGTTDGAAAQKALLTSTAITENGSYTSENGFSAVTVDVQAGGNRLNEYFTNQVTAITQSDLSGVTSIPDTCFRDKTAIKIIDLPSSVTSIGSSSIQNTGIETIDVSNVTSYGANGYNFYGNNSLTGITGFENYKGPMRGYMFNRCTALTGDFRTSVSSMSSASEAFYNCFNITSFTFLENIDNIANQSWANPYGNCTGVTYIDLTNNYKVPTLGFATAFSWFKPDYEIRVPDVLYDSWTAATNWSNSAVVDHIVPCATTLTYRGIKYHTTGSTEITFSAVTGYTFTSSTFDSTSGWGEKKFFGMTSVPKNAMSNNNSVTDIILGEGIKRVEDSAFAYCSALTAVTFPSTIEFIDIHWKLFGSSNFNTMTINAVTPPALGSLAFRDGNYAANGTLYVPSESVSAYQTWLTQDAAYNIRNWTVTAIPPYADCQITTTAASETVKIGYTYQKLADLADVLVDGVSVQSSLVDDTYTFADAGTHIVRYVYTSSTATDVTRQVDRLESYSASTEVKTIGQNALNMYQAANASQLASISLPGVLLIDYQGITNTIATDIYAPKVTIISNKALQFNPNLDPVSMPLTNVTFIGNNALRQSAIKEAHFGQNLATFDYNVFNECYSLSALTFDAATTGLTNLPSVGDKTYDLTDVVFPDCVAEYGQTGNYGLFKNSSGLTSVTFGSGSAIMNNLFLGNMPALTSITCKATTAPSIISGAFAGVTGNTGTLYVPQGSDYSTWAAELGSNWTVSYTL